MRLYIYTKITSFPQSLVDSLCLLLIVCGEVTNSKSYFEQSIEQKRNWECNL